MVLVDYIGIFFTSLQTFVTILYVFKTIATNINLKLVTAKEWALTWEIYDINYIYCDVMKLQDWNYT